MKKHFLQGFWAILWLGAMFPLHAAEISGLADYRVPVPDPSVDYVYRAEVDLARKEIRGVGEIRLRYEAPASLTVLAFQAEGELTLEMNGRELELLAVKDDVRFYRTPAPLSPGAETVINARFSITGAELNAEGIYSRQNWLPRLWWDGLRGHASYRVSIQAPPDVAVAASGRRNPQTGFYESDHIRQHGLFLGRGFKVKRAVAAGVEISMLHTPAGGACADYCIGVAADAVEFYKKWLGFYPHDFLVILPGYQVVRGGYPFATGMVVIHGPEKFETASPYHWTFITAHEIGHQYWGEWVLDGDKPDWLWIGLGVYADREYTEARGFQRARGKAILEEYVSGRAEGLDTTLDLPPDQVKALEFDRNNIVKHGKGFSVVSALETTLGREVFQKIYKKALMEYGGRRLGYRDFQVLCERTSGASLEWFFEQWVRSNRYLHYRMKSRSCRKEGDRFTVRLEVERLGDLAMPIPVMAVFTDGTRQVQMTDRFRRISVLEFVSAAPLTDEVIDPENRLPLLDKAPEISEENLKRALRILPWDTEAQNITPLMNAALEKNITDAGLWLKLGLIWVGGHEYENARKAFLKIVALNPGDGDHSAALVWLGCLEDLAGQRTRALEWYRKALAHPAGVDMRHSQFNMVLDKSWVEKRLKEPFSW